MLVKDFSDGTIIDLDLLNRVLYLLTICTILLYISGAAVAGIAAIVVAGVSYLFVGDS